MSGTIYSWLLNSEACRAPRATTSVIIGLSPTFLDPALRYSPPR